MASDQTIVPRSAAAAGEVVGGIVPAINAFVTNESSESTARSYQGVLRRFVNAREIVEVEGITAAEVRAFESQLRQQGAKPSTIRQAHMVLRSFVRFASAQGFAIDPAVLELKTPVAKKQADDESVKSLTRRQYERLLDVTRGRVMNAGASVGKRRSVNAAGARNLAMLTILGDCGLRSDELRTLDLDCLETTRSDSGRKALVVNGKGSYERRVPLTERAQEALAAWIEIRLAIDVNSRFLFLAFHKGGRTPRREPAGRELPAINSTSLERLVRELGEAAGIPAELRTVHALRHTYATLALAAGLPLNVLQKRMGHASIKTTEIYLHVDEDALDSEIERLDGAIVAARRQSGM